MRRFRYLLLVVSLAMPALFSAQGGTPPVVRNVVVTTQEGVAKSGTLVATDADGSPLTFSITTPPGQGTLTVTEATTGAFTYTPNPGAVGYDTFTYQVTDGSTAVTATGAVFIVASAPRWPGQTVRASVADGGVQQSVPSSLFGMPSADGRFIVFTSGNVDEAAGVFDLNVFVYDRQSGQTELVSKNASGQPIVGIFPWITPDGRYVAYTTLASSLPGNPTGAADVVVYDRQTGQTTRASVASDGTPGNGENVFTSLSADGRYVAFSGSSTNLSPSDTDSNEDVYLRDRQTGQATLISINSSGVKGNAGSWLAHMSADGRFIAFMSEATNLVANDTNGRIDVFVRDVVAGQTTRVSVGSGGVQASDDSSLGGMSADGRFVVFGSAASNLVAGDTNGVKDVFVRDRQTGQTTIVSVSNTGTLGTGAVEGDGTISADGRFVVFRSSASNLVAGDTNGVSDEFVRDLIAGNTVRVNVASDGSQANGASLLDDDDCCALPVISADGRSIVITSLASNLVPDDTNGLDDVFVVGPVTASPATIAVGGAGGSRSVDVAFDFPGTPWSATTTEPWITLNSPVGGSTSGTVSFTVAPNTGPARTGTIIAALQTITVNQGPPTVPVAQDSTISTPEDIAVASTLVASDADGDAITFSLVTSPSHGAVTLSDPATGAFTYMPAANFSGADSFTFRVSDGATFSNTATVTVNVTGVNDHPVAIDGGLATFENTLANGTLAATDGETDVLSFSIVTPPPHGAVSIVNAVTGLYAYTPAHGFIGSDSFAFVASDAGGSSNVATVAISVSSAAAITASFRTIGDLPGGPLLSLVRDATRVGGVIHAVGGSAANIQTLCSAPNVPVGCVGQFNPDTAVLWTSNAGAGVLVPLPNLVTPSTPGTNGSPASAITRDGSYIASQARSSVTASGQTAAVRVTRSGLVNLDLSAPPFLGLNPPSAALSLSDDGSIVYAIAGNPVRAFRFDINASSRVFIPLLLGSHTGNVVAGRAASVDGSVAVGTSFTAPLTANNGLAFRYVHGSSGGTVSAIPLLAGGTWNRAIAVSADGRLTVVAGNSSSQANGEVYVHDAITGVNTPFGSPMTPWAPANLAGITADGSVVAANFADPTRPNGSSHAYIHNANGWFHLPTVLVAAGIDLVAQGFGESNMRVTGVSPDGTLVFGSLERDDIPGVDATEGFVAELPAGYLKSFDVPAVPPTDTSIVGVWGTGGSGDDVVVFLADGTFFVIDTRHGTQSPAEFTSGFERGRYHWDASTGSFSFATLQDTNGSVGLSGGNGAGILPLTVSGNTLVLANEITLQRVIGAAGTVVGGWVMGDPRVENSSSVLLLFADGKFVLAEDGNGLVDPSGRDGVEAGTYVWGANGSFTVNVTLDATGEWGFGSGPGTGGTTMLQLSPDGLRLGQPGDPDQFKRVVDAAAVVPVITSPLVATGTIGTPFAHTIAATWASSFGATGLPNGLLINTTTGVISGTPTTTGTFPVAISATNVFNSTTTATLTITVIAPTTLAAANASGSFGGTTTLTATLISAGAPFAGQQVSFSLNGSPKGTATTNASGVATLSAVSLAGIGAGTYPTGVQASFAGDATHAPSSGSASLTIAKAIPVITWPAPADISHGTPLGPTQLGATANIPGTFTYTPPSGTVLNVGAGQTLSVLFTPTDGANFATVQAQVTITVLNAAPVARGVVVTTQEGVTKSGTLLANDAENDPLTFSIVTPPDKGTLTLVDASTGAFTYVPNAGAIGYDSFTFRATESGGASSTATGAVFIVASSPQWPGQTVRVNVANDGSEANGGSNLGATASADGRFIAFASAATNLSAGIPAGSVNVYVRDRQTGETTLASIAGPGGPAIGGALPVLTPDGRYIAFTTIGSTLPGGDPSAAFEAVVHDRQTGLTERVSVATNGTPGNGENGLTVISADGRFVAFSGTATNLVAADTDIFEDVYLRDRQTGQTRLVSVNSAGMKGNSNSWAPSISADGRFISFMSEASNLVPNDTNGSFDVFVRDLLTGQTTRVSVASGGAQSNGKTQGRLSADGRYVVLSSGASNLVPGDTNGVGDVFIHDRQTGQTTRVSVSSTGTQGNGDSEDATLSADGRFVAFRSWASNLVPGDTNGLVDEFVHDRLTGQTVRINLAANGTQANAASAGDEEGCCIAPVISADGRSIVMMSLASNLVAGDTNNADDVFVVGPVLVTPTTLSVSGSAGTHSVNVIADYPGPWTATTTTPWITIIPPAGGSGSGVLSFTVQANPGALRAGTIIVALQTVTVNQGPSTAPVAQNGSFTTPEDAPFSGSLVATDPDSDAITYSVVTPPVRGTVVITNPSTGAFTYTPTLNAFGGDSFTFQASAAGETSNVATVTISITPVDDAPVAFDSTLEVIEDTPATSFFPTTDGDSLTTSVAIVTPPVHGTVTIPNPTGSALGGVAYTYTPNANYYGPDSFTFRAGGGSLLSNIATISVSVAPVNDAPVANSVVVTTQEESPKSGVLLGTDIDGDALTFSLVTPPTKGTIVVNDAATGAFTYTPNAGALGYDTFTFRVADISGASATATAMAFIVAVPRWPGQTVHISTTASPLDDATSGAAKLSADGRYVAFHSLARITLPDDFSRWDIFVRDRQTGQVTRETVATNGAQTNHESFDPVLSSDGRWVAFASRASNLVSGDTNNVYDIFVRDRQTGQTTRVSVASNGTQANGDSYGVALSADARYVSFYSHASNLVGDDSNGTSDLFVHDRQTGQTTRVNRASDGTQANGPSPIMGFPGSTPPALSADGRFVAFRSSASNLVAGDTNGRDDVFVHDRQTGQTTRVSVASDGTQGNASSYPEVALSADGRIVAFASDSSNLAPGAVGANVFVHDRQTGQTTRVNLDFSAVRPALSADGRYVAFESTASNLVVGDTNGNSDVFVYDRQLGQTTRVSLGSNGTQGNGFSGHPALSADGAYVAFYSQASNLVSSDTNTDGDVFVVGGVRVSPMVTSVPASGGWRTVSVSFGYPGTSWTSSTTAPWITINAPLGGSTSGTVSFSVAPNTGTARTGTIVIALHTVTVTQEAFGGVPPPPTGVVIPVGTNVNAQLQDPAGSPVPISLTFSSVTQQGYATATPLSAPPASGDFFFKGIVYDISTTATYTPPVTVCFSGSFAPTDLLLHYESSVWQNVTTTRTPTQICGQVSSLSPFAIGLPPGASENQPPQATAGADQVVETTSSAGATVTLIGTGSDPDAGDVLTFKWTEGAITLGTAASVTVVLPIGTHDVTLTVTDSWGATAVATTHVVVREPSVPPSRLSGSAYNSPEAPAYRASFEVDVTNAPSPSGSLKYSYSRTRMNFVSTAVTTVAVNGRTVTIEGTGTVNAVAGYTFTATAVDGSPDTFAFVIRRSDGTVYYAAPSLPIAGGALTLVP